MDTFILAQASEPVSNWPIGIFLISVAFIVLAIVKLRVHAFIALIGAALLVGWLTGLLMDREAGYMVSSMGLVAKGFGDTAAGVGIVIALAAIIGMCLLESGAADRIVRTFIRIFGEKYAGWALLLSGFVLSIPVFFDTMFFLVIPLARMLALRTGQNYLFFVMCIGAGGAITHSIVPPTPGPLMVGNELGLNLGTIIIAGIIFGIPPAIAALYFAKWRDKTMPVPVREADGSDAEKAVEKKESELPGFFAAIMPIVLPVLLLGAFSFVDMLEKNKLRAGIEETVSQGNLVPEGASAEAAEGLIANAVDVAFEQEKDKPSNYSQLHATTKFLGDKIIALGFGALLSMLVLMRQAGLSIQKIGDKCGGPLETAGVIILITSAGGAFGKMIKGSGIADTLLYYGETFNINYIILAWVVTALVRIAQGSATVSMITGVGLMSALLANTTLDYHVFYIYLAIGFGSITCSWMNDSGFWIVGRLSGFTEKETFKSWTPMLTIIAVIGLVEAYLCSKILPFN